MQPPQVGPVTDALGSGPGPGLGRLAVAVRRERRRVVPVAAEVLGLAGLGDLQPAAVEQRRPQRAQVDVVHAPGPAPRWTWVEPPWNDGDAVGPEPAQQVGVVAVAEERLGVARARASASRWGITVIWSSPPMVARTARISGSPNAALRSAARSSGRRVEASRGRVLHRLQPEHLAEPRQRLLVHRRGHGRRGERRRHHRDLVAGRGLGRVRERRGTSRHPTRDHPVGRHRIQAGATERGRAAQGLQRAAYVVVGGAPVAHRDPHDRPVVPARARHPGRAVGEQGGRDRRGCGRRRRRSGRPG